MKHSIARTSPKGRGQEFIGTCVLCGKQGLRLTPEDMKEDCPNLRGLTRDEAVMEAVKGPRKGGEHV